MLAATLNISPWIPNERPRRAGGGAHSDVDRDTHPTRSGSRHGVQKRLGSRFDRVRHYPIGVNVETVAEDRVEDHLSHFVGAQPGLQNPGHHGEALRHEFAR